MTMHMTLTMIWTGLKQRAGAFGDDESGATAIEYGLIVAMVFLGIVAALQAFASSTSEMYETIDEAMTEQ